MLDQHQSLFYTHFNFKCLLRIAYSMRQVNKLIPTSILKVLDPIINDINWKVITHPNINTYVTKKELGFVHNPSYFVEDFNLIMTLFQNFIFKQNAMKTISVPLLELMDNMIEFIKDKRCLK